MLSSRHFLPVLASLVCVVSLRSQTAIFWADTGADASLGTSWMGGVVPGWSGTVSGPTSNVAVFGTAGTVVNQPLVNSNMKFDAVRFDGGTPGAASFTITGTGTIETIDLQNVSGNPQQIGVGLVFNYPVPTIYNAGTLMITGPITNNGSYLTITNVGSLGINGSVVNNATSGIILKGSGASVGSINGQISGSGPITISSGQWSFGATNSHTGATTINNGGRLSITSDANLGAAPATPTAGALALDGGTLSTSSTGLALASNRGVLLGAGGGTLEATSGAVLTYGGVITGTGVFHKAGAGTVALSGVNTYSGMTSIDGGTLRVDGVNALPTSTQVWLGGNGVLELTRDQQVGVIYSGPDSMGGVVIGGASTLTIATPASTTGGIIYGVVSGTGNLVFNGESGSSFTLAGVNTGFGGNTTVSGGTMYVTNSSALGTGIVTVGTGATLAVGGGVNSDVTLANQVALADGATVGGMNRNYGLILSGNVTLPAGASTVRVNEFVGLTGLLKAGANGSVVTLETGGKSTFGTAWVTGSIDPSISTIVANGSGLVFGSSTSVPTAGALSIKGTNAYVGVAPVSGTVPSVASVLALIDKANFTGVLGFDRPQTSGSGPAAVFEEAVDLSAFGGQLTLGSASAAVLRGTITPSATNGYMFGNGGGALVVESALTGNNTVTVNSAALPENYLILGLRGANTFTGKLSITNSIVVLDGASALPAASGGDAGLVSLGANGYIGYTENYTGAPSVRDFILTHVAPAGYTGSSIVGIDSAAYVSSQLTSGVAGAERVFADTIDLRGLGPISIGSTTRTTLKGPIYAPDQSAANRTLSLVAASDAELNVASSLVAGRVDSVVIGSTSSPYATGKVKLTGANTYAGGTTLNSGTLAVANSAALGGGTLTISQNARKPTIRSAGGKAVVNNAIALGGMLHIGDDPYSLNWGNTTPTNGDQLFLNGLISDLNAVSGGLDVFGNVSLAGANTFSGGVIIHGGTLTVENDSALGSGLLTLMSDGSGTSSTVTLASTTGPRTLANNLLVTGPGKSINLMIAGLNPITFNGTAALNGDLGVSYSGDPYSAAKGVLTFAGPVAGSGRFTLYGGSVRFGGQVAYNGDTNVPAGTLVFDSALPTFGMLRPTGSGYIGISFLPSNVQSGYLSRFDGAGTTGVIGFDTRPAAATNVFADPIDLRNFSSGARLGSSSSAILTGLITPQSGTYNFGGGGGVLEVRSVLSDNGATPRSVYVTSDWYRPTTVRLTGANTYSGGTVIENSALIFGAGALPSGGTLRPRPSAYVGSEDPAHGVNPAAFISRFDSTATGFFLGFDSTGGTLVSGEVSLAGFTSATDPQIYLSTTSANTSISGNIVLPTAQNAYRFAGLNGGQLTVMTTLTDSGAAQRSVVIGQSGVAATAGNMSLANPSPSSVTLTGINTYSGGTVLNAGALYVGSDSALGTGMVTVSSSTYGGVSPTLGAAGAARSIANPIQIGSAVLDVGSAYDLTLSGAISGYTGAKLEKIGTGNLTLSGNNCSFGGDILVRDGSVVFQTGASNGTGALSFTGSSGATVTYLDNATVNGISSMESADKITLTAGKSLTINQTSDANYGGTIIGQTSGLTLGGSSRLRLSGASTFTGPVTIQTTVIAANNNALGATTNAVTLNGGMLGTEAGVMISNPVTVLSGTLGGSGVFKAAAGSSGVNVGSNVFLSPGLKEGDIGTLVFDGSQISGSVLTLGAGGIYNWGMNNATAAGGTDLISVNGTVAITATSANPFMIRLSSFGADGQALNFDPNVAGSWTLLTANSITGFDSPTQFAVNTSGFQNLGIGQFDISLGSGATSLMLNFTPVPEPSTYALMLAGLGLTFFASRRRRNRR